MLHEPWVIVQTDVRAVRSGHISRTVQQTGGNENAFAFSEIECAALHLKFHLTAGNAAELQLLMPVPVDKAEQVFANLRGVHRHRKSGCAVRVNLSAGPVDFDMVSLHENSLSIFI